MKKKNLMLLLLLFTPASWLRAQEVETRPFSENHKTWLYQVYWNPTEYHKEYFTEGDTLIGGRECFKVYLREEHVVSYECAIFDEGKKTYVIDPGETTPRLLYDFGVTVGNDLTVKNGNDLLHIRVDKDTLIESNGKTFRELTLRNVDYPDDPSDPDYYTTSSVGSWIEGIGGSGRYFPYSAWWDGYNHMFFTACFVDGALVYSNEFYSPFSVLEQKRNMAVDGKTWAFLCRKPTRDDVANAATYRYYIAGDTVVGSRAIAAKKLYAENCPMLDSQRTVYVGAVYEEGRKVFIVPPRDEPWLLYDFGASPGDQVNTWMGSGWVQRADTVEVEGIPLRRLSLSRTPDGSPEIIWVEGIGSCYELLWNTGSWPRFHEFAFASCSAGGKEVFTSADFPLAVYPVDETDTDRAPYQPTLADGKQWNYDVLVSGRASGTMPGENRYACTFTLRGDTIVNGEHALKMYVSVDGGAESYHSAWIESGRKVYAVARDDIRKTIMFDYSLRRNAEWYCDGLFYLHHADTSAVRGMPHNRFTFCNADDQETFAWIEGIGQVGAMPLGIFTDGITENFSFLLPSDSSNLSMKVTFVDCYDGEERIYPQDSQPDIIWSPTSIRSNHPTAIYDLQGRRVNSPLRPGIYIQNGKAFVVK